MDYQCIVVYTIVRISPLLSNIPPKSIEKREGGGSGCLDWVKVQIKRLA